MSDQCNRTLSKLASYTAFNRNRGTLEQCAAFFSPCTRRGHQGYASPPILGERRDEWRRKKKSEKRQLSHLFVQRRMPRYKGNNSRTDLCVNFDNFAKRARGSTTIRLTLSSSGGSSNMTEEEEEEEMREAADQRGLSLFLCRKREGGRRD